MKLNWDIVGITASVACAIHCALLPVLFSSLPLLGVEIIHNPWFEWSMIGLSFVVGVYSLWHGYKNHHHSRQPLLIFGAGFLFLILKQFTPQHTYWFLAAAVIGIVAAHYRNYQLCHRSKCSSPHHKH